MKVVILAGGLGTRLSEETELKPKPMVEIGGRPILWHITKHYASFGHKEFLVALGYKGEIIKRFFLDYQSLSGSMTIDLADGRIDVHSRDCEGWTVHRWTRAWRPTRAGASSALSLGSGAGRSCSPTATACATWMSATS